MLVPPCTSPGINRHLCRLQRCFTTLPTRRNYKYNNTLQNNSRMKVQPILISPLVALLTSSSTYSTVAALAAPNGSKVSMPPLTSPSTTLSEHVPLAKKALSYFDSSPDPFHAVETSVNILEGAGFQELTDETDLSPGGKYYFTKNKSSLVAFAIGKKFDPSSPGVGSGFKIIGAHTGKINHIASLFKHFTSKEVALYLTQI